MTAEPVVCSGLEAPKTQARAGRTRGSEVQGEPVRGVAGEFGKAGPVRPLPSVAQGSHSADALVVDD